METIKLHQGFNKEVAERVCNQLLAFNQGEQKEIVISIDSPGGGVDSLYAIISAIDMCRKNGKKVHTYNKSSAYSCGAILLSCGDKRFAHPSSQTMIHEIRYILPSDQHILEEDLKEYLESLKKENDKMFKLLAKNMRMRPKALRRLVNGGDVWLTAEEAKNLKIVDVIGVPK